MAVFTGANVEEAVEKGLTSLGLTRSQANIVILAKESKGFLGLFGKKPAQVEISPLVENREQEELVLEPVQVEEPTSQVVADEQVSLSEQTEKTAPRQEDKDFEAFIAQEFDGIEEAVESPKMIEQAQEDVLSYVQQIIYDMDLEADISIKRSRRQIILQIDTPEPGRIIGYHGKVLKSLQLLAQNYLHDRHSRHFNVMLNVHDYLEHRTETLVDMAHRSARRVLDNGRPHRLEPMSNNERKIIHKTISQISGVESYSEGEDPERYVVIVSRD